MKSIVPAAEELVYVKAETPVTNSLKLATHFGKNHSDIIRAIKNRIRNYSESFGKRNFAEIDYLDTQGRSYRMFELTQDGFWAVVMGFTGEKAAKMQELFINEFNRRAAIIQNLKTLLPDQKPLGAPKKEYNHQYGYLQIKATADGYSEQEWVSGAKTIKEMTEIENHSRLQHKRISLERLASEFPRIRWLLIGDDGQHDERIYGDFVRRHPDHVRAVAIRRLTPGEAVLAGGRASVEPQGDQPVPWVYAPDGAGLSAQLGALGLL